MNNPVSPTNPAHALFPHPPGCTGHRLWQMLAACEPSVTRQTYLEGFDRRNLVQRIVYDAPLAKRCAQEMMGSLAGLDVVLLGQDVLRAFGLPSPEPISWSTEGGPWRRWCLLPHPSGRNLWYNDEARCWATGLLLEELRA